MLASPIVAPTMPPTPPKDLIGGHLLSIRRDPLGFFLKNQRDYGGLVHLKFRQYDGYQVNAPELIQQILTQESKIWHKSIVYKSLLADYLGNGLLISDGDFWKRQRKLMQPAFHMLRISAYANVMVDYTERMLSTWGDGQVRDMSEEMMKLTLYIVGKTLFDADLSVSSEKVSEALDYMLNDIAVNSRRVRLVRLPKWIPTPTRLHRQQSIQALEAVMMPIITERRRNLVDTGDLLSMLLLARDDEGQGMTDAQVRDEALTLILAGHETTANALTWTLYLLSQNSDALQKLHAEVDSVLAGRTPTLDDLKQLPYTEMVLKEGMRLFPPAWSFGRQNTEATQLGAYPVAPRSTVLIVPYVIHRNPDFFPEPERFLPERFSSENEARIAKYTYLPFGGGQRICIGNSFAMLEARLILASIVQAYCLHLTPQQRVIPEALVTLRPQYGMKMRLEKR